MGFGSSGSGRRAIPVTRSVAALSLAAALLSPGAHASAGPSSIGLTEPQRYELTYSYRELVAAYYRKVDPQRALDGARTRMLDLLRRKGVKRPVATRVRATADQGTNEILLAAEVGAAACRYGSRVSSRDLIYAAIAGLLASVHDPYTQFLPPSELAEANGALDRTAFGGIGVTIELRSDRRLEVQDAFDGGPAAAAGLQPGDLIEAIDEKTTRGRSLDDSTRMLRGEPGTIVRVAALRDGKRLPEVAITRTQIKPPSVTSKMLSDQIGYVRIPIFGSTTGDDLNAELQKLAALGAKASILDLRDNGGGYLSTAVEVSSQFIESGPIVSISERPGSEGYDGIPFLAVRLLPTPVVFSAEDGLQTIRVRREAGDEQISPHPLVVLVNRYTASASEITAGAIRDNGVGTIVGTRTFGKGVIQAIFPLPDGAAVKITNARYLTPSGQDINAVGITPDVVVEENKNPQFGKIGQDAQLDAAIGLLKGTIAATGSGG